ncbi:MAG TPA: hypothetical protein PKY82_30570, partial [Pyrinomonadaceae bacterium]|nr:hypothetical protein [Pyrinomonadaceae bacterium]
MKKEIETISPNENEKKTDEPKESLGLVEIPQHTFEYDLKISEGYQNFSSEILKLSLAGIGAISFMIVNFYLTKDLAEKFSWLISYSNFGVMLFFSLLFFGISSALALLHKYFGFDSKAYHLNYLRLEKRLGGKTKIDEIEKRKAVFDVLQLMFMSQETSLVQKAADERDIRNLLLKSSGKLL